MKILTSKDFEKRLIECGYSRKEAKQKVKEYLEYE